MSYSYRPKANDPPSTPDEGSPGGDTSGVSETKSVSRTITSAEILTLNSIALELVEGIPDTVIVPISGIVIYRFGTAQYETSVLLQLRSSPPHYLEAAAQLTQTEDYFGTFALPDSGGIWVLSDLAGISLFLDADADPGPGDPPGDSTLEVTVFYQLIGVGNA